jgi:hypothetical protein
MIYRCEDDLHFDLVTEILEHCIIKILVVVDCDVSRDAITKDDILPKEFSDGCEAYVCDGLRFNPLCEILNGHDGEGVVATCWG